VVLSNRRVAGAARRNAGAPAFKSRPPIEGRKSDILRVL
jgi:hypothetical protein